MNQKERIKAMKALPEHIDEFVAVTYINFHNRKQSVEGVLKGVSPFSYINIEQDIPVGKGFEYLFGNKKVIKTIKKIQILESNAAIMSIVTSEGKALYDNENIYPFYDPNIMPKPDQKITEFLADIKEYVKKTRRLSFANAMNTS